MASSVVKVSYDSGSEGDVESDDELSDNLLEEEDLPSDKEADVDQNDEETAEPSGWADAMAKILHKQTPKNKEVILAKGKTDSELFRKKRKLESENTENDIKKSVESDDVKQRTKQEVNELMERRKKCEPENTDNDFKKSVESDDVKQKTKQEVNELMERRKKKRLWEALGRVKPDIMDREKEKSLQRIATRGVVQLFNAVKKQQKTVEDKLKEAGSSSIKRSKVMKTITKGSFLDVLKGTAANVSTEMTEEDLKRKLEKSDESEIKVKQEPVDEDTKPSWNVLREDFMMGANMKDWDKETDEENDEEMSENSSGSDED